MRIGLHNLSSSKFFLARKILQSKFLDFDNSCDLAAILTVDKNVRIVIFVNFLSHVVIDDFFFLQHIKVFGGYHDAADIISSEFNGRSQKHLFSLI